MNLMLKSIGEHPRIVALLGTASGWFSVEQIGTARDAAQFTAAMLAAAVSLCALIITAPKAWAIVRGWAHSISSK